VTNELSALIEYAISCRSGAAPASSTIGPSRLTIAITSRSGTPPSRLNTRRPCSATAPPTRFTSSRQPPFAASSTPSILLAVHDHPVVGDQPVQRGVERARAQPDPAGRDLLDVEQDPVAVLGPGRERGQDEEGRLSERAVCHVIGGKRRQPAMLTIQ
jgi:hypothetical protein